MNKSMKKLIIACVTLVVIVALILVVVLVPWQSLGEEGSQGVIDYGIDMSTSVNEDGLHTAVINTNSDGEIENNSFGTLIEYVPSQIEKISVSTDSGSYTFLVTTPVNDDGTTEATVYTLEGFEDYSLASTNPSLLASALCNIEFTKVADLGEGASDYGFDEPRSEATVYYTDGTYSEVRLGDDAAGGEYCYIQFGDSDTVYVVSASDMEPLLFKITDLFSTSINGDYTSVADDCFDKITLGGTHLEEEVVIVANTDTDLSAYYLMSSHGNKAVSTTEGSNIVGTIKSLVAESVVCVNPDKKQIAEYGLDSPFATVNTTYSYTDTEYDTEGNEVSSEDKTLTVSLKASEQDSSGYVYMMEENGKVVYRILASNIAWATTSMEKLRSEYVLYPNYTALESVTVTYGTESYTFELSTEEVTTTLEDGSTSTETEYKVSLNGTSVDPDMFYVLYQDLALMEIGGTSGSENTSEQLLAVTYNYNTDRASDTVVFKSTGTQKVISVLNGESVGYVYKSYITALGENLLLLAEGKDIASVA